MVRSDFRLAPDERVDAVVRGQFDQINRKGRQRIARRAVSASILVGDRGFVIFLHIAFGNAVGNVVQNVQLADALLGQQIHGVRARLLKHRRQDVAAVDRRLARALRLQQGTLQNALEGGRRLRRCFHPGGQGFQMLRHEGLQGGFELHDVAPAVVDDVFAGGVIEQGVQDVLQRDVLVVLPRRGVTGLAERALQFTRQHDYSCSRVHSSG